MENKDLYWLAGLLEGEGSFMKGPPSKPNKPRISLQMTDLDVVERAGALMGIEAYHRKQDKRDPRWKPVYQFAKCGAPAVELMKLLRPLMGVRRQAQIDAALASYIPRGPGDNTRKLTWEAVREVRRRCAGGESTEKIAQDFNVSGNTIRKIRANKIWKETT